MNTFRAVTGLPCRSEKEPLFILGDPDQLMVIRFNIFSFQIKTESKIFFLMLIAQSFHSLKKLAWPVAQACKERHPESCCSFPYPCPTRVCLNQVMLRKTAPIVRSIRAPGENQSINSSVVDDEDLEQQPTVEHLIAISGSRQRSVGLVKAHPELLDAPLEAWQIFLETYGIRYGALSGNVKVACRHTEYRIVCLSAKTGQACKHVHISVGFAWSWSIVFIVRASSSSQKDKTQCAATRCLAALHQLQILLQCNGLCHASAKIKIMERTHNGTCAATTPSSGCCPAIHTSSRPSPCSLPAAACHICRCV